MIVLVRVLPVVDWAIAVMSGLADLGLVGGVLYAIGFGLLTSAFVPGSVLTMLAGATWGVGWGVLIIAPGCALASTLSALLGRTLLREATESLLAKYPILGALDKVIGQDALRFILLLRLSPVMPFAPSNYGLGLTSAPIWTIGVGTLFGIIPISALWVYLGTLAGDAVRSGVVPESPWRTAMLVVGLLVTFFIVAWLGKRAKSQLDALNAAA